MEDHSINIYQSPEPKPEVFRGKQVGEIVAKSVDETKADVEWLAESLSKRVESVLKTKLTENLQARLATLDDDVVGELEEELQRLRMENEQLQDTAYQKLKDDRRFKEQLICLLLYIYNDGEPLEVRLDKIADMADVDFAYEELDDEYIRVFTIEEEEE